MKSLPVIYIPKAAGLAPLHLLRWMGWVMADLRKRFGILVAAHRRRHGMTQESLAQAAGISVDMVAKIEVGGTGARFPTIEKLATALNVDPAEFFSAEVPRGALTRGTAGEILLRLVQLDEAELRWVRELLEAALTQRHVNPSKRVARTTLRSGGPSPKKRPPKT